MSRQLTSEQLATAVAEVLARLGVGVVGEGGGVVGESGGAAQGSRVREVSGGVEPVDAVSKHAGGVCGGLPVVVGSVTSSVAGSDSSGSWADEVEDDNVRREVGLVMPADAPVVRGDVRSVVFGGTVDKSDAPVLPRDSFFKTYVKTAQVDALRHVLQDALGVKFPRAAGEELALCVWSTATVPVAFHKGPDRLRSLAAVGDGALTFAVVGRLYQLGAQVRSMQQVRGTWLSDASMQRALVEKKVDGRVLSSYFSFPANTDPRYSKIGADAVEAVAGVLSRYFHVSYVLKYVDWLQLVEWPKV